MKMTVLCVCVCLLNITTGCAETAEPVKMPFGLWTCVVWVGLRNHVLGGCLDPPGEGAFFSGRGDGATFVYHVCVVMGSPRQRAVKWVCVVVTAVLSVNVLVTYERSCRVEAFVPRTSATLLFLAPATVAQCTSR